MKYIEGNRVIIKSWCNEPEDGAIEQAKNLANLPFVFKHVALMPDTHLGYGMPIGGVIGTKGVVIPNAVGVDIGCGMCAVKTHAESISKEDLKLLMGEVRKVVPVGFSHQKERQDEKLMPKSAEASLRDEQLYPVVSGQYESARKQLGTLGGGNHFIDILRGSDGYIWIMLHSGSRNLGLKVAKYHNDIAKELNAQWYSSVPVKHDLAFLPLDTEEAKTYLREMNYCVDFALANRKLMMDKITEIFSGIVDHLTGPMINIAHNYASMESHFGQNVMIHRKGATLARAGTMGIIPGSMGTASYIVRGKGNPESFDSCSHGAGRSMGRKAAIRTLNFEEETKRMEDKGIIHGIRNSKGLDEAPGSYKDIEVVMDEQKDLVDIVVKLEPIAVIKG